MRLKTAYIFAGLVFALLAVSGASAQDLFATVTAVKGSRVTVDVGANAEIEVGDILVVQSAGFKKGLVRVVSVSGSSAVAETVRVEPGSVFARGDVAAYQLLQPSSRLLSAAPMAKPKAEAYGSVYPAPRVVDELPPWMGDAAPAAGPTRQTSPYSDLDSLINAQKDILAESPSDRRAMYTLADLYFQKGWYDQSITWNQRAVEASPDAPDNDKLYYQIASAYAKLGDIEKRDIYMRYLKDRCPDSVFAYESPAIAPRVSSFAQPVSLRETAAGTAVPTIHGTPGTVILGAGATIRKIPGATAPEARKGKIKILPIK